jgi:hypothetical protein
VRRCVVVVAVVAVAFAAAALPPQQPQLLGPGSRFTVSAQIFSVTHLLFV